MASESAFGKRRFDSAPAHAPAAPARPRAVQAPRAAAPAGALSKAPPLATLSLLLGLTAIFAAQEFLALGTGPAFALNYRSLLADGGADMALVKAGEWWRLFTAPLLHANAAHIIGNGVVLLIAGLLLERLIGWAWFAAIFAVSALAGSAVSIASNDPQVICVGASGAIMGLLAAILVCSFHPGAKGRRVRMRWLGLRLMIPALLPIGGDAAHAALQVDYSAHFGGALAGAVMGLLVNSLWPQDDERPLLGEIGAGLGALGLAAAALSLLIVAVRYPGYDAISRKLAPDEEIPNQQAQAMLASTELAARYPDDPRVRFFRAIDFENAGAHAAAEAELRAGLEKQGPLTEMPPKLTQLLQYTLAVVLLEQGRDAEARTAAAPLCGHPLGMMGLENSLAKTGLCSAPSGAPGPAPP